MAQAAFQEELIPAGGIADFVMSDAEIAALESEEAEQQFGTAGIARFEPIAKRMASYGRYGDDQVAHVETGELLVPRALIEGNPELKESIFGHLREMGIENPERYVVGSGKNSINPDTGLPEFFFKSLRRAVSKVAKGVSKAVSKVGKVLKKVAPIALTIAGTAAFGPMYGAAFGSGIGTLIQGGNLKDALKASLKAGALGGISAGLASKFGGGTFMEGVSNAADFGNVSAGFESIGKATTGDFSGFSMKNMSQGPTAEGGTAYQAPATETLTNVAPPEVAVTPGQEVSTATDISPLDLDAANVQQNLLGTTSTGVAPPPAADPTSATSFFDTAKEYGKKALDFFDPRIPDTVPGLEAEVTRLKGLGYADDVALEVAQANIAKATPSMISRYAPLAAAGTGIAAAGGFFDAAPQDDPNLVDRRTGMDLIAQNPSAYMVGGRTPQYATGETVVGTQYGYAPPRMPAFMANPFRRPEMYAADGGQVYPRRNGGIMPNEGVPDQDSVRALLMPGEFVMTKNAVRGLGNGNLNQGINNMYSMMRNLESKGQVA